MASYAGLIPCFPRSQACESVALAAMRPYTANHVVESGASIPRLLREGRLKWQTYLGARSFLHRGRVLRVRDDRRAGLCVLLRPRRRERCCNQQGRHRGHVHGGRNRSGRRREDLAHHRSRSSTAAACLDESVVSSNSQNGLAAIHDYSVSSLADELSGKQYTCTGAQGRQPEAGTHTAFDGSGTEGESTPLERFDSVVFTVA